MESALPTRRDMRVKRKSSQGRELTLLIGAVRRKLFVMIAVFLIVGLSVGAWGFVRKPQYHVGVQFAVSMAAQGSGDSSSSFSNNAAATSRVRSYVELVKSDLLLTRAADETGMTVEALRPLVTASAIKDTVLFKVSVEADSPEIAAEVGRALAVAYPEVVAKLETPQFNSQVPPVVYDATGREIQLQTGPQVFVTVVSDSARNPAVVPPTRNQIIALGVFLGLVLGVTAAVIADLIDRRIRRSEEFESLAPGIPVLGEVPDANLRNGQRQLLDFRGGYSSAAEAIRGTRTALSFVGGRLGAAQEQARVILISSSLPGEGKTFISANLAAACAEAGSRVLIVGADLRSPRIADAFGVSNDVGLSNVLAGQIEIEDVVFPGSDYEPDVLPAGYIPPNPSELLGSQRMVEVLCWARQRYDIIFIDTPPIDAVTDAMVLTSHVDALVLVSRVKVATRSSLVRTLEKLALAGVQPSGLVLNAMPAAKDKPYGQYGGHPVGGGTGVHRKNASLKRRR